jgi:hypothetical protein
MYQLHKFEIPNISLLDCVPFEFVLNNIRRDLKEQAKQKRAEEEFA